MKDCKIVQDLLPSYIENLTSKDTSEYVEGHLKTCEDCTKVYNDMKSDLKVKSTTPKAEIDYMKKARKKMRIAEKLVYIILLLFIIFVLIFWREIFSFICYTDICNKYLAYQDEIMETGKYTLHTKGLNSTNDLYRTPDFSVNKYIVTGFDDIIRHSVIQSNSDIPGATKIIRKAEKRDALSETDEVSCSIIYSRAFENMSDGDTDPANPMYPRFSFDEKATFWELMSTFSYIRNIRIDGDYYEIDVKDYDTKVYLFRGDHFEIKQGEERSVLRAGEVDEKEIEKALEEPENTILVDDYSNSNRSFSEKITTKLSNCDQEAGTVVAYDFKVSKEESSSLKYLGKAYNYDDTSKEGGSTIERLREIAVSNLTTYKKFQERWSGLRDLTEEDFINYTALIMIDTDNTKELHYKEIGCIEEQWAKSDIFMTESEANGEYQYSGCLLLVPNYMLFDVNSDSQSSHDYMVHIANN